MNIKKPLSQSIFPFKGRAAVLHNTATEKPGMSRDVRGESLGNESLFLTIARYSCWKNHDVSVNHPSVIRRKKKKKLKSTPNHAGWGPFPAGNDSR